MSDPQTVTSAYIHIPFCVRKCSYCDFCSYPGVPMTIQSAYTAALGREIEAAARWAAGSAGPGLLPLKTVFFGGGTPTVLPAAQLAWIISRLDGLFGLAPDGEYTLEANPGTVSAEGLDVCQKAGFNRISFGLQAAQPHLLALLGRIHEAGDFIRSVQMAHDGGFRSINADIMLGLPGQTLADVDETIALVLSLPIDHVSFYSLSLEDGTPLKQYCAENPALMPDEDTERAQYDLVRERLRQSGFIHYEISNAAKPGRECRHNLVYWQAHSYFGFGAAAHSCLEGYRRGNTGDLEKYLSVWDSDHDDPFSAVEEKEYVDEAGARREMMMLGLRLLDGVSYRDFAARFGVGMTDVFSEEISRLQRRGLLVAGSDGIRLSPAGLDLANQVFMEFV